MDGWEKICREMGVFGVKFREFVRVFRCAGVAME